MRPLLKLLSPEIIANRKMSAYTWIVATASSCHKIMNKDKFKRCLVLVADGARADIMAELVATGQMPQMSEHLISRGSFRKALTVFPSTTGPAHIPFVSGIHPGKANCPGYRWLSRSTHDTKARSAFRHRSLNTLHGLFMGRDMDHDVSTSLYEYFERPSAVYESIDFCNNRKLFKVKLRRLFYVTRAHFSDDWGPIDKTATDITLKRLRAGSDCIVTHYFGVDEYSHLYSPTDKRTIGAYKNIDNAIGLIASALKDLGKYDDTIMAVVSDHGLSATSVHIPVVDIVKEGRFNPFYYPKLYRKEFDSAVMESGNSMAQLYFKRGDNWGENWTLQEMESDPRIKPLIDRLVNTEGISFAIVRTAKGICFVGSAGKLNARSTADGFEISIQGTSPLPDHPEGTFGIDELRELTFENRYPDAVNQSSMLFASERSGDLFLSSEPGYDLRWQHEDPEHHSSHGSLHREHMHVPFAISVPIAEKYVQNVDLVPTILALSGKRPNREFDGQILHLDNGHPMPSIEEQAEDNTPASSNGKMLSLIITLAIIASSMILTGLFKDDINNFGIHLLESYGQWKVDVILFLLTAISSTPLTLPIWGYAMAGVAMGYNVIRLASVMALGSATGSLVTFLLGRYFGQTDFVARKFPNLKKHPWTEGRSLWMVSLFLFLGTASPIPCDVFYAACGLKKYPTLPFWLTMVAGRFIRYSYLGYGFEFFKDMI